MDKISFVLPNLVAFSYYTVHIHLEKWLMRYDTKRAIWCDLYNKHISIFCIKHMSIIFRTLQFNKWQLKNQALFSFCEINATKFGSKNKILHTIIYHYRTSYGYIIMIIVDSCMISFHVDCIMQLKKSYHIATNSCSRKVLLLLVISLTVNGNIGRLAKKRHGTRTIVQKWPGKRHAIWSGEYALCRHIPASCMGVRTLNSKTYRGYPAKKATSAMRKHGG